MHESPEQQQQQQHWEEVLCKTHAALREALSTTEEISTSTCTSPPGHSPPGAKITVMHRCMQGTEACFPGLSLLVLVSTQLHLFLECPLPLEPHIYALKSDPLRWDDLQLIHTLAFMHSHTRMHTQSKVLHHRGRGNCYLSWVGVCWKMCFSYSLSHQPQ